MLFSANEVRVKTPLTQTRAVSICRALRSAAWRKVQGRQLGGLTQLYRFTRAVNFQSFRLLETSPLDHGALLSIREWLERCWTFSSRIVAKDGPVVTK